ncbi:MAG TPA: hypothetical protein VFU07_09650 [Candidatus Lumbricidophila sp.]|nr:hypothetical protein [Candidatus Lumbricidophila sp.]
MATANFTVTKTATLMTSPNYALQVIDGSITIDEAWSPHVQASITIARPSDAVRALLDPRDSRRVQIFVQRKDQPAGGGALTTHSSRVFNLCLRTLDVDHNAGTYTLTLASDECLMQDRRKVTSGLNSEFMPYQNSLGDIVDYAVGVIGGTYTPGTSTAEDISFKVLENATNLIANPKAGASVGNWIASGGNATLSRITGLSGIGTTNVTTAFRASFTGANSQGIYSQSDAVAPYSTVTAGRLYYASSWVRTNKAGGASVRLSIQWTTSGGGILSSSHGSTIAIAANTWTRITIAATAPATAARAGLYSYLASGAWAAGNTYDMTAAVLVENLGTPGMDYLQFFDGDGPNVVELTPDDDSGGAGVRMVYSYAWTGTVDNSTSTRTRTTYNRSNDSLLWAPGVTLWEFIEPLVNAAGGRLYCTNVREWHLDDRVDTFAPVVNLEQRVNVIEGRDIIDLGDAATAVTGVLIKYSWTDSDGAQHVEYDSAGSSSARGLFIEYNDRANPGAGTAARILGASQNRGRKQDVVCIPDFSLRARQQCKVTLPGTLPQIGSIAAVTWNLGNDTMTVKTRDLVDDTGNPIVNPL